MRYCQALRRPTKRGQPDVQTDEWSVRWFKGLFVCSQPVGVQSASGSAGMWLKKQLKHYHHLTEDSRSQRAVQPSYWARASCVPSDQTNTLTQDVPVLFNPVNISHLCLWRLKILFFTVRTPAKIHTRPEGLKLDLDVFKNNRLGGGCVFPVVR